MIVRFLNWQGIAGIAVSLAVGILLLLQKGETRHWQKRSATFEQLYHQEQAAFSTTVADYRAAAVQARAADQANSDRVAAEQAAINQRTANEYANRLAAARADAQRLRVITQAAADPGPGRDSSMPRLSAAAGGAAHATGEDGFPDSDRELATEQAIQLDELIQWVRAQAKVVPNKEEN